MPEAMPVGRVGWPSTAVPVPLPYYDADGNRIMPTDPQYRGEHLTSPRQLFDREVKQARERFELLANFDRLPPQEQLGAALMEWEANPVLARAIVVSVKDRLERDSALRVMREQGTIPTGDAAGEEATHA